MTEPVEFSIARSLKCGLHLINGEGSYHINLSDPNAVSLSPADYINLYTGSNAHDPFCVIELKPTRRTGPSYGDILLETAICHVWIASGVSSLDPFTWAAMPARIAADVEHALIDDRHRHTLAADTVIRPFQSWDGPDRIVVEIPIECVLLPRTRGTHPTPSPDFSCFT